MKKDLRLTRHLYNDNLLVFLGRTFAFRNCNVIPETFLSIYSLHETFNLLYQDYKSVSTFLNEPRGI